MLKSNKVRSLVLVGVLISLIFIGKEVRAQEVIPKIGVAPHTFELGVLPGQLIEEKFKIINQSEVPIPMTVKVVNFTAEEDSGQMIFDEYSQDPSFTPSLWFKIENPDFILDPGEVEKVRFQIQVPEDVEAGGHYAVLIFEPKLPSFYFKEEALVKNIPEIGVLFLFSVKKFTLESTVKQRLEVVEFSLPKEKRIVRLENIFSRVIGGVAFAANVNIVESPYLNFILRIKNNDIYHLKPYGKVLIYDFSGKRVGEAEIPKQTILPGKTRIFSVSYKPEIPEKLKWLPVSVSEFLVKNFFIGKYKTKVHLEAKSPLTAEVFQTDIPNLLTFFSLPWKFWLAVVSIFGLLLSLFIRYRERIKLSFRVLLKK